MKRETANSGCLPPKTDGDIIGNKALSAWLVGVNAVWVQTRSSFFNRKLSQRADARLVAHGIAGGYLRIYEFEQGLAWAGRLIARYTRNGMPTNARKNAPSCPLKQSELESTPNTP